LIIIQQLIVINEGQLCSFDEASVRVDAAGVRGHRTADIMASLTEAKFFSTWEDHQTFLAMRKVELFLLITHTLLRGFICQC
jgi:hypothetical protein